MVKNFRFQKISVTVFKQHVDNSINKTKHYLTKHILPTAEEYIELLSEYRYSLRDHYWVSDEDKANPFFNDKTEK